MLNERKAQLGLASELKWQRISAPYAERYIDFINYFFDFVDDGTIKLRIMFRQNRFVPTGLSAEHKDNRYFILYYHFFKHAFGLQYCDIAPASVQLLLDEVPHNRTKLESFRRFIARLSSSPRFAERGISFAASDITEVDSKQHPILQGLDIVLGVVCSRLNDKHNKPEVKGQWRSKRALAKAAVFKATQQRVFKLYPNFNIGSSTGMARGHPDRWAHPYRHWDFLPNDRRPNPDYKPRR